MPYYFGGNTGLTQEQITRQREIAKALLKGRPKKLDSWAAGLNSATGDILAALLEKKASDAETKARERFSSGADAFFGDYMNPSAPGGARHQLSLMSTSDIQRTELPDTMGGQEGDPGLSFGNLAPAPRLGMGEGPVGDMPVSFGAEGLNDYQRAAYEAAVAEGVPPHLFMGLVEAESAWRPDVWSTKTLSSAGAIGPAQLMPGTARDLGVDPYDINQNLRGGARYFKTQLDKYGDPQLAAAAYNAGPGAVDKYGGIPPFSETQAYVPKVLKFAEKYRGLRGEKPQRMPVGPEPYYPGENDEGAVTPASASAPPVDRDRLIRSIEAASRIANAPPGYVSDAQRAMAQMILQRSMAQLFPPPEDPMDAIALEKAQIELEQMRNPAPDHPSDVREYEYAKSQGYPGTFIDFQREMAEAGRSSTTINNNLPSGGAMPGLSKLGEGYTYLYNPDGSVKLDENGMPMSAPVPGGPAAAEADQIQRTTERREAAEDTQANVVSVAAQRAREAAQNRNLGATGTSLVGKLPWTDSAEVMRQVGALKDMASASFLNAMRQQSPTGGALGNVTERELDLLSRQAGALDPNSPYFLRDLDDYERTLLEIIHGPRGGAGAPQAPPAGDGQLPAAFVNSPTLQQALQRNPNLTPEAVWEKLSPGLREKYRNGR